MLRHVGLLPFESKWPGRLELDLQKKVFATPAPDPGAVPEATELFPSRHDIPRPAPSEKCETWIVKAAHIVSKPSGKKKTDAWLEMLCEASGRKWKASTIEREYFRALSGKTSAPR
jgi:hypothetical protein